MAEFGKLNFAVSFNPQTAFPLDARSYFESLEEAKKAAASAVEVGSSESVYYFGQTVVVVEGGIATSYVIQPDNSLVPLAQDSGEAVKVAVDEKFFKYGEDGNLTFATAGASVSGYHLGINSDGKLDWIAPINAYTKTQTDAKIAEEIAKVDHLSRKIVESISDIDVDATDAMKYIYMVPNGLTEDDDKYNEYMVIEVEGVRKLEKVGDWAVDLDDYATKASVEDLTKVVDKKVDSVEGSRLMTNLEGSKLAGIEEGAEVNYVKSVTAELSVDENGQLGINNIAQAKVSGLTDALDKKVDKVEGWTLLSPSDAEKLSKLTVGDSGNLEVSGSVSANNVKGLEDWITGKADSVTGLSENNFSTELKEKLEGLVAINSVNADEFELSVDGQLSIKKISTSKIDGIDNYVLKTDFDAHANEFKTYQSTINSKFTSMQADIDDIKDALTWKDIE